MLCLCTHGVFYFKIGLHCRYELGLASCPQPSGRGSWARFGVLEATLSSPLTAPSGGPKLVVRLRAQAQPPTFLFLLHRN